MHAVLWANRVARSVTAGLLVGQELDSLRSRRCAACASCLLTTARIERGVLQLGDQLNARVDRRCRPPGPGPPHRTHLAAGCAQQVVDPRISQAGFPGWDFDRLALRLPLPAPSFSREEVGADRGP